MMSSTVERFGRLRAQALAAADKVEWLGPLLVRVALGLTFIGTGWGKLHDLDTVTQFFRDLGIPAAEVQAPMVAAIEFVGGIAILLGLGTRLAALPLAGTMVVAIATAKWPDVHGATDLVGSIEFAYLAMFVWLALRGAGRASLDHAVSRLAMPPSTVRA